MKLPRKQLLLGTAAVMVAVFAALTFLGRSSDDGSEQPTTLTADGLPIYLQWRPGSSQTYDFLVDSGFRIMMPGASSGQSMRVHLKGVLDFRTLEVSPGEALIGMRLSSVDMLIGGVSDPDTNRALMEPFRVRFAASGLPIAFEFPGAVSAELRGVLENLVRMFQVEIRNSDTWVAQEPSAAGVYEAAYVRTSSSQIRKTKQGYVASTAASADSKPGIASNESIRIEAQQDWISGMTVDETFESRDPSGLAMEVSNHATLVARAMSPAMAATAADSWSFVAMAMPDVADQGKVPGLVLSPEEAEKQLRAGITTLDATDEGRSLQVHRLSELLLIDGALPFVLLETMREQDLTDRTRADLYLALELAGSPQAQAALTSVFTDPTWSQIDGMRAIVALRDVTNPTEDTLAALRTAALTGQASDDYIGGTAALALGSLGSSLNASNDPNYASLRADLSYGAFSASDPHQRAVFIRALGNTGDPSLQPEIVPLLDDPSPLVRGAAAETLGRLGSNEVANELVGHFDQETSSEVRGAIAGALKDWEEPSPAAMQSIRTAVLAEIDENARYQMALLLANNLTRFPDNSIVLEDLLRVEQSQRIRQQVADLLVEAKKP